MKPASLTIKGLYSYQQETFIDFANLTSSGLFGIFGAVGSGKSTILEAITFALYNETDRLNARDSRSYNMMNLKSNELLIDFIFTCGDNDDKYRFIVKAKRNKKTFDDTGAFERKVYIWKADDWEPKQVNAANILNLSYENFKRTIIIPQGKFQEFLQLKDNDRVLMLKEIFGLERFELSSKVSKLIKDNDLKVSNMQGQM
jgi:exonuclease SbcC